MNKLLKNLTFLFLMASLFILISPLYSQSKEEKDFNRELNIARTKAKNGDSQQAITMLDSLKGFECLKKQYAHLTEIQLLKANIYGRQNAEEKALFHYAQAFEFAKETKDPILQLDAVMHLGEAFYSQKLYQSAYDYFKIGDSLLFWANKSKYRKQLNSKLANTAYHLKNYNDARYYYSELLKYSVQYQDLNYELEARNGIADSYAKRKEFQSAIQFKLSLIPIYKRLQQPTKKQAVYIQIAKFYMDVHDADRAMDYCYLILNDNQPVDALLHMKTHILLASIQIEKGALYETQIMSNLDKAASIATKLKRKDKVLEAAYLKNQFIVKYKSKKLAKKSLDSLVALLDKESDIELQIKIYQLGIDFYKKQHNYKKQAEYYELYLIQKDESEKLIRRKAENKRWQLKMIQQNELRMQCAIQKGILRASECL